MALPPKHPKTTKQNRTTNTTQTNHQTHQRQTHTQTHKPNHQTHTNRHPTTRTTPRTHTPKPQNTMTQEQITNINIQLLQKKYYETQTKLYKLTHSRLLKHFTKTKQEHEKFI